MFSDPLQPEVWDITILGGTNPVKGFLLPQANLIALA